MTLFNSGVQKIKLSKKFHDTCVKIGECKSREEEENIVGKWMSQVKKNLEKPKAKLSDTYESVVSLVHLSLLGYNTSFGHINAVNLTQEQQLMPKALGYLACSALLDSKSEMIIMMINSTQRDLSSGQPVAMALALTAICQLVTPDLIQPVIGYVGQCLTHTIPLIREKAIMCVHSFIRKDASCVAEFFPELVRLLGDSDLSIVNAVVNTFSMLLRNTLNVRQICDSLTDLCNVCTVIQTGQARMEYYHQRVLAPFVLMNIFTLFRRMKPHMSEMDKEVEPILTYALQNYSTDCAASASVLYEAIKTTIELGLTTLPQLRGAISLFMSSDDRNYKFVGLGLLQSIPDFADEFQSVIIDCLEHPDATIRLRTLALLHSMANESNAQIIVISMLKFFQKTKNDNIRRELADRITAVASSYATSPIWFAKTMEQLFTLGGDQVKPDVAFAVLKLIHEKCDDDMRRGIVDLYIDIAQTGQRLSDVFVIVIANVIGCYGELSEEYDLEFCALLLCDLADQYEASRDWVLSSLLQVIGKLETVPSQVVDVFEQYKKSKSIMVQEMCFEAVALLNFHDSLVKMNDPIEDFDSQMTFLDDFVEEAIEKKGMKDYIPLDERESDIIVNPKQQLKFTYTSQPSVYGADAPKEVDGVPRALEEPEENGLNTTGIKMVWGETGLATETMGVSDNQGVSMAIEQPQEEKKVSMFQKLAIKKPQQSADDIRKEKQMAKMFGKKVAKKAVAKPAPVEEVQNIEPVPGPFVPPTVTPDATKQRVQLTENDYILLDQIAAEISAPPPQEIRQFSQSSDIVPVYEDAIVRIAMEARDGCILLAVFNSSTNIPMMNFSVDVTGPEVFRREVCTHPKQLIAVPPQNAVWYLASFKFPRGSSGFPDFKFKCTMTYNNNPISIDLPVDISTFISPVEITTQQFGGLWKQGGNEVVYKLKRTPNLAIDDVSQVLNSRIHVKTVQRIGVEEIFIGTLVSTPLNILVHVKFGADTIDMKVLTKAQPLTQAIVKLIQSVFA